MYQIEGSWAKDCVTACCCLPCALIQDEREVRDREDERRRQAGPASAIDSYIAPGGMEYAPQQGRWTAGRELCIARMVCRNGCNTRTGQTSYSPFVHFHTISWLSFFGGRVCRGVIERAIILV